MCTSYNNFITNRFTNWSYDYITLLYTIGNGFVKLFLKALKNKRTKYQKIEILAKLKLNCIESMILKAIHDSHISERVKLFINDKINMYNK